ncbi:hypothetical protein Ddc_01882 [Ditylenchus destructor]|nr:hypothetical protein Ddc_01882 [Ditylenchus destructor]
MQNEVRGHETANTVASVVNGRLEIDGIYFGYELGLPARGDEFDPREDIIDSMCHEIVHFFNLMAGIPDVEKRGGRMFHNQAFNEMRDLVRRLFRHQFE